MRRAPPKAVSFDLDGTLYSMRSAALRMLFTMPGSLRFLSAYQRLRREIRGQVFEDGAALRQAEQRGLARRLGITPEQAAARLDDIHNVRFIRAIGQAGPRPAALPLLRSLVERDVPLAVLSDLPVERKLAALGLSEIDFTVTLDSAETGALKPHPRAFEHVAARLGVPVTELVHVGDRLDTDVRGALAAGASAVWLCRGPRRQELTHELQDVLVIQRLEDLYLHWDLVSPPTRPTPRDVT